MNKEIEAIRKAKEKQVKDERLIIIKDHARVQDERRIVPSPKG